MPVLSRSARRTIAQLRAVGVVAVAGNNDRYLAEWGTPRWSHTLWMRLRRSDPPGPWLDQIAESQARITADDLAWLRALPEELTLADGRVYVCHGMPGNPWNSMWPRSPIYDANVSDADCAASLRMLGQAELVLCGHISAPREVHDRYPDGRAVRIVRAGPVSASHVSFALLTRLGEAWDVQWGAAEVKRPRAH